MGGVVKGGKKLVKGAVKGVSNLVDASLHPQSAFKKHVIGAFMPEMPATPDQPLMPDFEGIAKARRRGRTRRLGRAETQLTDTLG